MHETPKALPHEYPIVVSEAHLDELGHLNNARYFEFFEMGRVAWYAQSGLIVACLDDRHPRCDTAVVNINCDFASECRAGERLVVATWPKRLGNKSFALLQRILKENGETSAEAVVTSVVMDLEQRKSVPLPGALVPLFPDDG